MTATLLVSVDDLAGGRVVVTDEGFHHLFRVRRLQQDDRLRLVDGHGGARWGQVEHLGRRQAILEILGSAPSLEPALDLELIVGTPKSQRASWLVEKATEIGVTAVRFISTDRSPRQVSSSGLERLSRVARAAVEQCGRAVVPTVTGTHSWTELEGLVAARKPYFLDLGTSPAARIADVKSPATLLVGPEGGWSQQEQAQLVSLGCGAVGLGSRTLRVETAAALGAFLLIVSSSVDTF